MSLQTTGIAVLNEAAGDYVRSAVVWVIHDSATLEPVPEEGPSDSEKMIERAILRAELRRAEAEAEIAELKLQRAKEQLPVRRVPRPPKR